MVKVDVTADRDYHATAKGDYCGDCGHVDIDHWFHLEFAGRFTSGCEGLLITSWLQRGAVGPGSATLTCLCTNLRRVAEAPAADEVIGWLRRRVGFDG